MFELFKCAYVIYESATRAQQQNSAASEPKVGVEPPMPTLASTSRNDFSGWNLLCQAIDRVLFLSYLVIILIFIASYLGGATLASQTWSLKLTSFFGRACGRRQFRYRVLLKVRIWNISLSFSSQLLKNQCWLFLIENVKSTQKSIRGRSQIESKIFQGVPQGLRKIKSTQISHCTFSI